MLALICVPYIACSQGVIKISGTVHKALTTKYNTNELLVRTKYTTNILDSSGPVQIFKLAGDGSFKGTIQLVDSLNYLSFELEENNIHAEYDYGRMFNMSGSEPRSLTEVYLFEVGDSVNIDFGENAKIVFSGKGSDKLNCQWRIHNTIPIPGFLANRLVTLVNEGNHVARQDLVIKSVETAIATRRLILESCKGKVKDNILRLLFIDAVSDAEYALLHNEYYTRLQVSKSKSALTAAFLDREEIFFKDYYLNLKPDELFHSAYYADMVMFREFCRGKLLQWNKTPGSFFNRLYDKFTNNYQSDLKDKLIYLTFETQIDRNSTDAKIRLPDALNRIKNERYRGMLRSLSERMFASYPFELPDVDGRLHRLADYKGKLVVIDYWFTGCSACIFLNKAMYPIMEQFKNNKDIVFISVSPDQKTQWIKSINSGLYTHPNMVHLYTNGLGVKHPFVKNYNLTGAPRQIIIGKDGTLITTSPPRSDVGEAETEAFIGLIQRSL